MPGVLEQQYKKAMAEIMLDICFRWPLLRRGSLIAELANEVSAVIFHRNPLKNPHCYAGQEDVHFCGSDCEQDTGSGFFEEETASRGSGSDFLRKWLIFSIAFVQK